MLTYWTLHAERSFVLWNCCRAGEYYCVEDVWSWSSYIFVSYFWHCEEGKPWYYYYSIDKQPILFPIFNLVWTLSLCSWLINFLPRIERGFFYSLQIFCSSYQHKSGQMRLRVTTLSRRWVAGSGSIQASLLSCCVWHNLPIFVGVVYE